MQHNSLSIYGNIVKRALQKCGLTFHDVLFFSPSFSMFAFLYYIISNLIVFQRVEGCCSLSCSLENMQPNFQLTSNRKAVPANTDEN